MTDIGLEEAVKAVEDAESGSPGNEARQGHAELGRRQEDNGLIIERQQRP